MTCAIKTEQKAMFVRGKSVGGLGGCESELPVASRPGGRAGRTLRKLRGRLERLESQNQNQNSEINLHQSLNTIMTLSGGRSFFLKFELVATFGGGWWLVE